MLPGEIELKGHVYPGGKITAADVQMSLKPERITYTRGIKVAFTRLLMPFAVG